MKRFILLCVQLLIPLLFGSSSQAWSPSSNTPQPPSSLSSTTTGGRRSFVSSLLVSGSVMIQSLVANAADEEESFASIAARASKISKALVNQPDDDTSSSSPQEKTTSTSASDKNAYDFTLPIAGQQIPIRDIVRNQDEKVKAILFVNIKQDDVVARKNIPELIALAAKYVYEIE